MIGLIAGFGRCGSSMVMSMLSAGGLPIVGFPPLYETAGFSPQFTSLTFLQSVNGTILKWLDPTWTDLPQSMRGGPILWLDRDPSDWAESHMKLRNMWEGTPLRRDNPVLHSMLADEVQCRTEQAIQKIADYGPLTRIDFADILASPVESAKKIRKCFRPFGRLDARAAARVVRDRSPECAPDMEFDQDSALACVLRTVN